MLTRINRLMRWMKRPYGVNAESKLVLVSGRRRTDQTVEMRQDERGVLFLVVRVQYRYIYRPKAGDLIMPVG